MRFFRTWEARKAGVERDLLRFFRIGGTARLGDEPGKPARGKQIGLLEVVEDEQFVPLGVLEAPVAAGNKKPPRFRIGGFQNSLA